MPVRESGDVGGGGTSSGSFCFVSPSRMRSRSRVSKPLSARSTPSDLQLGQQLGQGRLVPVAPGVVVLERPQLRALPSRYQRTRWGSTPSSEVALRARAGYRRTPRRSATRARAGPTTSPAPRQPSEPNHRDALAQPGGGFRARVAAQRSGPLQPAPLDAWCVFSPPLAARFQCETRRSGDTRAMAAQRGAGRPRAGPDRPGCSRPGERARRPGGRRRRADRRRAPLHCTGTRTARKWGTRTARGLMIASSRLRAARSPRAVAIASARSRAASSPPAASAANAFIRNAAAVAPLKCGGSVHSSASRTVLPTELAIKSHDRSASGQQHAAGCRRAARDVKGCSAVRATKPQPAGRGGYCNPRISSSC